MSTPANPLAVLQSNLQDNPILGAILSIDETLRRRQQEKEAKAQQELQNRIVQQNLQLQQAGLGLREKALQLSEKQAQAQLEQNKFQRERALNTENRANEQLNLQKSANERAAEAAQRAQEKAIQDQQDKLVQRRQQVAKDFLAGKLTGTAAEINAINGTDFTDAQIADLQSSREVLEKENLARLGSETRQTAEINKQAQIEIEKARAEFNRQENNFLINGSSGLTVNNASPEELGKDLSFGEQSLIVQGNDSLNNFTDLKGRQLATQRVLGRGLRPAPWSSKQFIEFKKGRQAITDLVDLERKFIQAKGFVGTGISSKATLKAKEVLAQLLGTDVASLSNLITSKFDNARKFNGSVGNLSDTDIERISKGFANFSTTSTQDVQLLNDLVGLAKNGDNTFFSGVSDFQKRLVKSQSKISDPVPITLGEIKGETINLSDDRFKQLSERVGGL